LSPGWIITIWLLHILSEHNHNMDRVQEIEETFRDLKSLLGMTKHMNKQQVYMEKMLALLLLTFTKGLHLGDRFFRFYDFGSASCPNLCLNFSKIS